MNLAVSDHALLRFLDRAGGLDIEGLRYQLQQSLALAYAAARSVSGSDFLIRADGLLFVVRGDTVTTIVPDKEPAGQAATLEGRNR